MAEINPRLTGFRCIRCERAYPVADYPEGCAACLAEGHPASVVPTYDGAPPAIGPGRGMRRFAGRLPYVGFPALGEGDTPLVPLERLAAELGLESLHAKLEGANPTGSHKDRMSAQFIARAEDRGAPAVIVASSGNAGASLAAYAAAAGLACTVVTTPAISPIWRRAIEMFGASLLFTKDSLERWAIVKEKVRGEGYASATNYLDPPVGSDPYGVDGYKTLGYELAEDEEAARADTIVVPTARGDLLWGIHAGLADAVAEGRLARMPRLVAVEPFPRLETVLAGADLRGHFPGTSALVSINGATATYQSLAAVRLSGGTAVSVAEADVLDDQRRLARAGLYLELSSAAGLTALRRLAGRAAAPRRAVMIATSHGYKEAP